MIRLNVIRERSANNGGVIFFDLVPSGLESYNKFIPYYLHPDSLYTVSVSTSPSRTKVSVGSNPWAKAPLKHNLATICERYGGGGHAKVGAISFPDRGRGRGQEGGRRNHGGTENVIRTGCALALALILISCGKRGPSPDSEAGANAALSAFVDSYFTSYFNFNPSEATSVGLHDYDSRLEERNSVQIQARIAELQSQANEIESLRKKPLGFDESIDATLLANRIQAELLDLNSIHVWRSPLYYAGIPGNAVDLLMKRNFAPAPARLASLTARLRQVPALIQAMRDNTAEPPKEFTELALRIVKGSVPFFREAVPEWAKTAAGQDQKLMAEFNDANRKAVASLSVMSDHLERNVLPTFDRRFRDRGGPVQQQTEI